ncbi:MAG: hypothetical protein ACU85U_09165 [Gammaproteobacteria bacterium]
MLLLVVLLLPLLLVLIWRRLTGTATGTGHGTEHRRSQRAYGRTLPCIAGNRTTGRAQRRASSRVTHKPTAFKKSAVTNTQETPAAGLRSLVITVAAVRRRWWRDGLSLLERGRGRRIESGLADGPLVTLETVAGLLLLRLSEIRIGKHLRV